MATFDQYEGVSHSGYVKDFRALQPGLPDGTTLMVVTTLVLQNGVWKYKNGWSKVNIQKATIAPKKESSKKVHGIGALFDDVKTSAPTDEW
jgi:hypothetical protein